MYLIRREEIQQIGEVAQQAQVLTTRPDNFYMMEEEGQHLQSVFWAIHRSMHASTHACRYTDYSFKMQHILNNCFSSGMTFSRSCGYWVSDELPWQFTSHGCCHKSGLEELNISVPFQREDSKMLGLMWLSPEGLL